MCVCVEPNYSQWQVQRIINAPKTSWTLHFYLSFSHLNQRSYPIIRVCASMPHLSTILPSFLAANHLYNSSLYMCNSCNITLLKQFHLNNFFTRKNYLINSKPWRLIVWKIKTFSYLFQTKFITILFFCAYQYSKFISTIFMKVQISKKY